eukprot:181366_1
MRVAILTIVATFLLSISESRCDGGKIKTANTRGPCWSQGGKCCKDERGDHWDKKIKGNDIAYISGREKACDCYRNWADGAAIKLGNCNGGKMIPFDYHNCCSAPRHYGTCYRLRAIMNRVVNDNTAKNCATATPGPTPVFCGRGNADNSAHMEYEDVLENNVFGANQALQEEMLYYDALENFEEAKELELARDVLKYEEELAALEEEKKEIIGHKRNGKRLRSRSRTRGHW